MSDLMKRMGDDMSAMRHIAREMRRQHELSAESANQRLAAKWMRDIAGDAARTKGVMGKGSFVARALSRAEGRRTK